ncbi:MAG: alpha/beta hydrolase [Planctomycetes bacterium]|nr:alpha/beta hydrolase [Planctomycetota bacterium]
MAESHVINLWPEGSKQIASPAPAEKPSPGWQPNPGRPKLDLYPPTQSIWSGTKKRGCVIICPGGGYGGLANHEGEPFARLFAMHGLYAAVLTYRVSPNRFPAPYNDACRAIRIIRSRAEELGIDPQRIAIMGFSAGGHLASTVATQPTLHVEPDDDLAPSVSARPDRVILGYPVVSFVTRYHAGSAANLLGPDPSLERRTRFSNELHVTKNNPPAFIFHTGDDAAVPVENALMFASAYAREQVPCELHIYPTGPHGVGMALGNPALRSWTGLLIDWLQDWITGV